MPHEEFRSLELAASHHLPHFTGESVAPASHDDLESFGMVSATFPVHCSLSGSSVTLMVRATDTIDAFVNDVAMGFGCSSNEIKAIFRGRIISASRSSTLESIGLKAETKILILKKRVDKCWSRIRLRFPLSSIPTLHLSMHCSSSTLNLKRQLHEMLGLSVDDLLLFLGDGQLIDDETTIRDLGLEDEIQIYCIVDSVSAEREVSIGLGDNLPFLKVKIDKENLMKYIVETEARKDAAKKITTDKTSRPNQSSAKAKSTPTSRGEKSSKTFLGLRKGFLTSPTPRRRKSARIDKASPAHTHADESQAPSEPDQMTLDSRTHCDTTAPAQICAQAIAPMQDSSCPLFAASRARRAGIPESLRTGRLVSPNSGGLAQLQMMLQEALSVCGNPPAAPAASNAKPEVQVKVAAAACGVAAGNGRCAACRVRVGLAAVTCRCGATFCARHRYAEAHACTFDYKAMQRTRLEASHPAVVAPKLPDRI